MTPYVRVGGWQMTQWPPFKIGTNRAHTWIVAADRSALAALCDQVFAVPSRHSVEYTPQTSWVGITLSEISNATASDPAAGATSETDLLIWFPVARSTPRGPQLAVFCPWLFVDHAPAVWSGREMFGLPKEWATFEGLPSSDPQSRCLRTSTWELDAPGGSLKVREVLRIHDSVKPLAAKRTQSTVDSARSAFDLMVKSLPGNFDPRMLSSASGTARFAAIKQLPSATRPGVAVYSSILEMKARVDKVVAVDWGDASAEIDFMGGPLHPFSATLGVAVGRQRCLASFTAEYGFTLLGAEVIWSLGGSPAG